MLLHVCPSSCPDGAPLADLTSGICLNTSIQIKYTILNWAILYNEWFYFSVSLYFDTTIYAHSFSAIQIIGDICRQCTFCKQLWSEFNLFIIYIYSISLVSFILMESFSNVCVCMLQCCEAVHLEDKIHHRNKEVDRPAPGKTCRLLLLQS